MTTPSACQKMCTGRQVSAPYFPPLSGTGTEVTAMVITDSTKRASSTPWPTSRSRLDVYRRPPACVAPARRVSCHGHGRPSRARSNRMKQTAHSPYTDAMAPHAIRMIQANLVQSCRDQKARAPCTTRRTGRPGLFERAVKHRVPHGPQDGAPRSKPGQYHPTPCTPPAVICFNAGFKQTADRFADIACVLGFGGLHARQTRSPT